MNCDEVRPLVGASVDRELSAGDEWRVRQHLASCADCRRAADSARAVGQAVRAARYQRAPDSLGEKIAAALGAAAAQSRPAGERAATIGGTGSASDTAHTASHPPRRRAGWRDLLRPSAANGDSAASAAARPLAIAAAGWMAAALLALAALGLAVALNQRGVAGSGPFVDELVASHVRAQLSGRDLDVSSSDRHTVKPWFNGRIDYTPPVEDLAAAGFPLVGGRLDYVGRERVAVLVYHYRLHVIDVYVFPPDARAASSAAAPPTTPDGFALAHWERAGMSWWAVTDAGPDVLASFRAALDARLRGS